MLDLVKPFTSTIFTILLIAILVIFNKFKSQSNFLLPLNLLLLFEGFSIILTHGKTPNHIGYLLSLLSGYYTILLIKNRPESLISTKNIASNFLIKITTNVNDNDYQSHRLTQYSSINILRF